MKNTQNRSKLWAIVHAFGSKLAHFEQVLKNEYNTKSVKKKKPNRSNHDGFENWL